MRAASATAAIDAQAASSALIPSPSRTLRIGRRPSYRVMSGPPIPTSRSSLVPLPDPAAAADAPNWTAEATTRPGRKNPSFKNTCKSSHDVSSTSPRVIKSDSE